MDWRKWNGGAERGAQGNEFGGETPVVALMDRLDGGLPPDLAQIEAYWLALRGDTTDLPARADFRPQGVADQLHATMLLERIAPGMVRIRLAGMALADLLGMELRGMPLSALFVPEARDSLAAHLEQVFDGPRILRMRLEGEKGLMRPTLRGEVMILPMRGHDGQISRALASPITEGRIGRAPRRLAIRQAACLPVPEYAAQQPDKVTPRAPVSARAPARAKAPPAYALAEAPASFDAAPPKGAARFRVIDGGLA